MNRKFPRLRGWGNQARIKLVFLSDAAADPECSFGWADDEGKEFVICISHFGVVLSVIIGMLYERESLPLTINQRTYFINRGRLFSLLNGVFGLEGIEPIKGTGR